MEYRVIRADRPSPEIEGDDYTERCEWFLHCNEPATGTTPHPILGDVPTCDRCHKFATA